MLTDPLGDLVTAQPGPDDEHGTRPRSAIADLVEDQNECVERFVRKRPERGRRAGIAVRLSRPDHHPIIRPSSRAHRTFALDMTKYDQRRRKSRGARRSIIVDGHSTP